MIAAAGVIFNSLFIYDYNHASFSTTFLTMGQANRFSGSNSYKAIAELQNTESAVERYGGSGIELEQMNNSMLSGAYSSVGYLSLTDPSTNNFQKEMGLVYNNFPFWTTAMQTRISMLLKMLNTMFRAVMKRKKAQSAQKALQR